MNTTPFPADSKKLGVIVGGSGLIGGALIHYLKAETEAEFDILAPNSKRLSLREPGDIRQYFKKFTPDFIINAAIASIDSDPKLAFEINYLGAVYLARAAVELNIPYIHFSTAAVLPPGQNLREEDHLPLAAALPNYPKSKLMAERTLKQMAAEQGLDYTTIRLAVVYGEHDHKIQGFQRLFYSIADQAMPVMFTNRETMHSYSNAKKLPSFVHHLLLNRAEFSGETYHFVDPNPVSLSQLILTIKSYMEFKTPREIYLPYPVAEFGMHVMARLIRRLSRIGIEARMPAELMFLKKFYQTQILSAKKLARSSFVDPAPESTVFTELPALIQYYLTRWEHLNLIAPQDTIFFDPQKRAEVFLRSPETLLEAIHEENNKPFLDLGR